MDPKKLVEAALRHSKATSGAKLGELIGIDRRRIADYAANKRWPDNNHARMLAEAAGLNPFKVIAELEMARAEDDSTRTAWGKALASVTGKAVMVLLAFVVTITVIHGSSLTTTKVVVFAQIIDDNFYYVNFERNQTRPEKDSNQGAAIAPGGPDSTASDNITSKPPHQRLQPVGVFFRPQYAGTKTYGMRATYTSAIDSKQTSVASTCQTTHQRPAQKRQILNHSKINNLTICPRSRATAPTHPHP